jgi:hypothetical protein
MNLEGSTLRCDDRLTALLAPQAELIASRMRTSRTVAEFFTELEEIVVRAKQRFKKCARISARDCVGQGSANSTVATTKWKLLRSTAA